MPPSHKVIDLSKALETGEFSDLELVCQGENIPVHRVVLCSQSPVFRAACTGSFIEAEGRYKIDDFSVRAVRLMVDYLYTGTYSVNTQEDGGRDRYETAGLLINTELCALADKYLIDGLEPYAVIKYASFARKSPVGCFLLSIGPIFAKGSGDLRDMAVEIAHERLHKLQDLDSRENFDHVLNETPVFAKQLLYYVIDEYRARCCC